MLHSIPVLTQPAPRLKTKKKFSNENAPLIFLLREEFLPLQCSKGQSTNRGGPLFPWQFPRSECIKREMVG